MMLRPGLAHVPQRASAARRRSSRPRCRAGRGRPSARPGASRLAQQRRRVVAGELDQQDRLGLADQRALDRSARNAGLARASSIIVRSTSSTADGPELDDVLRACPSRWYSDDSDYLPEYALKKKCPWTMNSRQGNRYIKARMGNDLKQKILIQNGILPPDELKGKPSVLNCARCSLVNAIENKYCSKCSYPLTVSAFDEIKLEENNKFKSLAEKYDKDMKEMRDRLTI